LHSEVKLPKGGCTRQSAETGTDNNELCVSVVATLQQVAAVEVVCDFDTAKMSDADTTQFTSFECS